jgi:hypothetical protein
MPRPKSILQRVEVDEVRRAHDCQHNKCHRLQRGEKRLKLWNQRSYEHYCAACALDIIARDIARLQDLAEQLRR